MKYLFFTFSIFSLHFLSKKTPNYQKLIKKILHNLYPHQIPNIIAKYIFKQGQWKRNKPSMSKMMKPSSKVSTSSPASKSTMTDPSWYYKNLYLDWTRTQLPLHRRKVLPKIKSYKNPQKWRGPAKVVAVLKSRLLLYHSPRLWGSPSSDRGIIFAMKKYFEDLEPMLDIIAVGLMKSVEFIIQSFEVSN